MSRQRPDVATVAESGFPDYGWVNFVGINDLTISGNVVYDWTQGISVMSNITPGTSGINGLNRLGSPNAFPQVITGTLFCLIVAAAFEIFFAIVQRLTIPRGIRV